jgi:hypothetical protein
MKSRLAVNWRSALHLAGFQRGKGVPRAGSVEITAAGERGHHLYGLPTIRPSDYMLRRAACDRSRANPTVHLNFYGFIQ